MVLVIIGHSKFGLGVVGTVLMGCYMPAFFFTSGYTMNTNRSMREVALKRIKGLLIPYFVYSLFITTIYVLVTRNHPLTDILKYYFSILYSRYSIEANPDLTNIAIKLYPQGIGQLWFLSAMFLASIFTIIFFKAKKSWKKWILLGFLVISMLLSKSPILLPWSIDTSFLAAIFMIVGCYYKKIEGMFDNKRKIVLLLLSGIIYVFVLKLNPKINMSIRIYGDYGMISVILFTIIGITGSLSYLLFFEQVFKEVTLKFITRIGIGLAWIGRRTITFLGTHMIIIYAVTECGMKLKLNDRIIGLVSVFIALLVGTFCSLVIQKMAEHRKIFRYL